MRITEEYTIVQMRRQGELTGRIQDKRAKATRRGCMNAVGIEKEKAVA